MLRIGTSEVQKIMNKLLAFLKEDDLEFYEKYLSELSEQEVEEFFQENPDFMDGKYQDDKKRELLKDSNYRSIMKKIRKKEEAAD